MNNPKTNTQDSPAVARLLEVKSKARQALAGDSNDAEHDALFEAEEALVRLTPDVRRMQEALKLCVEFLQTGEVEPTGKRRAYSLWAAAVSSGRLALGHRLTKGEEMMLRRRRFHKTSTKSV